MWFSYTRQPTNLKFNIYNYCLKLFLGYSKCIIDLSSLRDCSRKILSYTSLYLSSFSMLQKPHRSKYLQWCILLSCIFCVYPNSCNSCFSKNDLTRRTDKWLIEYGNDTRNFDASNFERWRLANWNGVRWLTGLLELTVVMMMDCLATAAAASLWSYDYPKRHCQTYWVDLASATWRT